ncbi:MAG: hypothetical protein RSD04_02960 [Clostridia bacterium]
MTNYELMKMAEHYDEDCQDLIDDFCSLDDANKFDSNAESFKKHYKEFYTDIKLSHKEDW